MKSYILTCSCHNMGKRVSEAFTLMFPNKIRLPYQNMPPIVKGRDRLYKLGKELQNDHIIAISKLSGKFAYYVELDDNNTITKEINLLTGARIA